MRILLEIPSIIKFFYFVALSNLFIFTKLSSDSSNDLYFLIAALICFNYKCSINFFCYFAEMLMSAGCTFELQTIFISPDIQGL